MVSEAFRGEVYQKVDSKARVSIPAAFRRILDAGHTASADFPRTRMVMVYGGKSRSFVECYSQAGAEKLARMVDALSPGTKERLRAERNLITLSVTVEIDDDGRIVLPVKVRDKMGVSPDDLAKGLEAAFAGTLDRFQLWTRAAYDAEVQTTEDEEEADGTDVLSLLKNIVPGV